MKKIILLSLTTLFLITSCKNALDLALEEVDPTEEGLNSNVEEIVFGRVYGACVGSCRALYLLNTRGLYDDLDTAPTTPYVDTPFSTTPLAADKYNLAQLLLTAPSDLLTSTAEIEKQIISDTDYYLQIKTATGVKTWIWDDISEDADSRWREYFDQVEATVLELIL